MADTTAAGGDTPQDGATEAAPAKNAAPASGKPSLAASLVAGIAASRINRDVGDVPLGVVPMMLIATGLTLVGQRNSAKRGLQCLAGGGVLIWRAHVRAR